MINRGHKFATPTPFTNALGTNPAPAGFPTGLIGKDLVQLEFYFGVAMEFEAADLGPGVTLQDALADLMPPRSVASLSRDINIQIQNVGINNDERKYQYDAVDGKFFATPFVNTLFTDIVDGEQVQVYRTTIYIDRNEFKNNDNEIYLVNFYSMRNPFYDESLGAAADPYQTDSFINVKSYV